MSTNPIDKLSFLDKFLVIPDESGFKRKFILGLRVLVASAKRFWQDECLMIASGISYTAIVSLVPTLTVALALVTISSGFNEKQDEIFEQITTFLQKNEIKLDINPYLETLKEIISSATQIGAIGFVVLIFSATAVLRTFEAAFTQIWRIKNPRPFAEKIIFFFFILAVGPLLFTVLLGFALKLTDKLRLSHLYSVARDSGNFLWITGERGTIIKIDDKGNRLSKLSDLKIDYENMTCFNLVSLTAEAVCDKPELNKDTFIKIRGRNKHLYTLSQNGTILTSEDSKFWLVDHFLNTKFKDFGIGSNDVLYLGTESGEMYRYKRGEILDKYVFNTKEEKVNINRIRFFDSNLGFLLDTSGRVWKTTDGGKNFSPNQITKNKLEDIAVVTPDLLFVVGERGTIFKSEDSGKTWKDISHKKVSFTKVWGVLDGDKISVLILNSFDQILHSKDLGENWEVTYSPENGSLLSMVPINPNFGFKSLNPEEDEEVLSDYTNKTHEKVAGDLLAVGEFTKVSIGDFKEDRSIVWKTVSGGDKIYSLYSILKFLMPLLGIWAFFMMLYTIVPNTKVPLKPAILGSLITSIIFLLFLYGYSVYIRSFSNSTMIIYRALAAIPLFLLSLYCFAVIILFGAEVTATLQYRDRYASNLVSLWGDDGNLRYDFYKCVKLLTLIYQFQLNNKALPDIKYLEGKAKENKLDIVFILEILSKENLILMTEDKIAPSLSIKDLTLYDLFKILVKDSFQVPEDSKSEKLALAFSNTLSELGLSTKENLEKYKLVDLLEENTNGTK
ncbi:MAG: YhjD/YihY/BrkB family envelope integrity protein [Leptospiraceae bacterium]|nr:YhjD/YihY/BrkB family envelope integrity protein [Leptospiraceae bacterium]